MTPDRLARAFDELKAAPYHLKIAKAEALGAVALDLARATETRLKTLEEKCQQHPATR